MEAFNTELTMATASNINESSTFHNLIHEWNLWAHLPQDPDWTNIESFKKVYNFKTLEETIAIVGSLPENLIKNCMLFIMRDGITPMWEDPKNKNGGGFSYRVSNKVVVEVWRELSCILVGETISTNNTFVNNVTGITISPKKNFCIIKIWMSNCDHQNPQMVTTDIKNLVPQGCLFKKHL